MIAIGFCDSPISLVTMPLVTEIVQQEFSAWRDSSLVFFPKVKLKIAERYVKP
jgi:hypothetical protein